MAADHKPAMQTLATFLVMLDLNHEYVLRELMRHHPYETEADMQDAIGVALGRKRKFERDLQDALDREAIEEEHRG